MRTRVVQARLRGDVGSKLFTRSDWRGYTAKTVVRSCVAARRAWRQNPQRHTQASDRWLHALEQTQFGGEARSVAHDGDAGVEQAPCAAAPVGALHELQRSGLREEGGGNHRAVPELAGVCCGVRRGGIGDGRSRRSTAMTRCCRCRRAGRTARVRVQPARHAGATPRGASGGWAGDSRDRRQPLGAQDEASAGVYQRPSDGGPHFTLTYSSWWNEVELCFAKISRDVITSGVFSSVADLKDKLNE